MQVSAVVCSRFIISGSVLLGEDTLVPWASWAKLVSTMATKLSHRTVRPMIVSIEMIDDLTAACTFTGNSPMNLSRTVGSVLTSEPGNAFSANAINRMAYNCIDSFGRLTIVL